MPPLMCALCGGPLDSRNMVSIDGLDLHPGCYEAERYTDPSAAAGESTASESLAGVPAEVYEAIRARGLVVAAYL
jgi:hypothetical protein